MDDQLITDRYAIYNADCMDVMTQFPSESIHLSVYSPPFGGLYHYSSSERDLSNARDYDEFFEHYRYIIGELSRLTMPGRITAVHCMDVPTGNSGKDALTDFLATSSERTSRTDSITSPDITSGRSRSEFATEPSPRTSPIRQSWTTPAGAALPAPTTCWYSASAATTQLRSRTPPD